MPKKKENVPTPHKVNKTFAKTGHDCELPAEDVSDLQERFPGDMPLAVLNRFFCSMFLASEKICKACATHLRSHGSIMKERKRQLEHYSHTIHPYSNFRHYWDCFMIMINFVQLIMTPIDAGLFMFEEDFPGPSSDGFARARTSLDLICCTDIGIHFITGYYDETKKEVILTYKAIAKNYLKGGFLIDALASFPTHWELLFPISRTAEMYLQGSTICKVLRIYIMDVYVRRICNIYNVSFYTRQGTDIFVKVLLFWHICAFFNTYGWTAARQSSRLSDYNYEREATTPSQFVAQILYHGALLIHNVSSGVLAVNSRTDYLFIILSWCLSKIVQIFLLARVIEFMSARTASKRKYLRMVRQLSEFMRHKKLPMHNQKRILDFYQFHYQKNYFRESEIFSTISTHLRQELVMQKCRQLVQNVEFFRDLPFNLLVRIVSFLRSEIYMTNDVVVRGNSRGDCMYLISSGTVAVYTTSGKEICHLTDGDYFGEIALIQPEATRVATVLAVEITELYRLDRNHFVKAIHPYPDLLDKIQKIAAERYEDTITLDDLFKKRMQATKGK